MFSVVFVVFQFMFCYLYASKVFAVLSSSLQQKHFWVMTHKLKSNRLNTFNRLCAKDQESAATADTISLKLDKWRLKEWKKETGDLQLSSLNEFVPTVASISCSCLSGEESDVVFCGCSSSTLGLDMLCILSCFSAHYSSKESLFEFQWPSCQLKSFWPLLLTSLFDNAKRTAAHWVLLCHSM